MAAKMSATMRTDPRDEFCFREREVMMSLVDRLVPQNVGRRKNRVAGGGDRLAFLPHHERKMYPFGGGRTRGGDVHPVEPRECAGGNAANQRVLGIRVGRDARHP